MSALHSLNPVISVIIPTLNRERSLCTTLEYFLTREKYWPFEIIVIDQSVGHERSTVEFLERASDRIKHVMVEYKSLTTARNHGLQLAIGEVVVFVDDDTEPFDGFLTGHVKPYLDQRIWMVAGGVVPPGQSLISRDALEEATWVRLLDEGFFQAGFDYFPCTWAAGCNFSVRKSAAVLVGGFDERFYGVALGEDAEFSCRIKNSGGLIYYSASAALVHKNASGGGCRSAPPLGYVFAYAENTNYFWWKIQANWLMRARGHWVAYRQLVLNRRNCTCSSMLYFGALNVAFVCGMMSSMRKRLSYAKVLGSIFGKKPYY
jgi:GT2 family glycosyltransferase